MHIGGQLIKEFDAFLHLFRSAADVMRSQVIIPAEDQFALGRALAGLGGPPAASRAAVDLNSRDSLPALCLFLAMRKDHCPIAVTDPELMARIRQLVHLVAHTMVPMAAGGPGLTVEEAAAVLTETEVALRPLVTYNEDGEIASVLREGCRNRIRLGPAGGPFKLVINPPAGAEPELDRSGDLHPVILEATWRAYPFPFLKP